MPLNIWAGQAGVSPAAEAWTTATLHDDIAIDQFVASATVAGETSRFLRLPGGRSTSWPVPSFGARPPAPNATTGSAASFPQAPRSPPARF